MGYNRGNEEPIKSVSFDVPFFGFGKTQTATLSIWVYRNRSLVTAPLREVINQQVCLIYKSTLYFGKTHKQIVKIIEERERLEEKLADYLLVEKVISGVKG